MKIFCVGRNYIDHVKELDNKIPDEPVIFIKPKSALLVKNTSFYYPEFTNELHYECELVFRVSKNGKYIPEFAAADYVNAVTVGIDFTARDLQADLKAKGLPWEKAKAWDHSAVVGEWQDLPSPNKTLHFSLDLNGKTVQEGRSDKMLFPLKKIIANISKYFALNIGDVIFTGTPSGVGECTVGDVLTGYLENNEMFSLTIK